MIIYIFYFILLYLLGYISKITTINKENSYKYFIKIIIVALIMLFGLRSIDVGIDTKGYYFDYLFIDKQLGFRKYELGYYYFTYLIKKLGLSWQVYLIITGSIMIIPLAIMYNKKSTNFFFSFFLFMTIGNFTMYLSGLRQSLAISLTIISITLIDDNLYKIKGIILFTLLLFLACQFHVSAIVFLVYYIFMYLKPRFSKFTYIVIVFLVILSTMYGKTVLPFLMNLSPEKYANFDISLDYQINPLLIAVDAVIPTFCAVMIPVEKDGKFSNKHSLLLLCSTLCLLLLCLSRNNGQIGRLSYYFSFSNTLLIPESISYSKGYNRLLLTYAIVVLCLIYFFVSTNGGTLHIDSYKFFWN